MSKASRALGGKFAIDPQVMIEQFQNLNPNDPSAWPLLPRVAFLVGVFWVVMAVGWYVWSDLLSELDAKQKEEDSLKQEYVDKKRMALNLDPYRQQLQDIDRSFGKLLKQLPSKSEIDALLIEINQAGLGRGLQFELFKPGQEVLKDFYAELPVTVRINGSYHDLGAFAADIAKLPRIVTLNNMTIVPAQNGMLTLDAVTKTFRYLDASEEPAKSPGAGAKK